MIPVITITMQQLTKIPSFNHLKSILNSAHLQGHISAMFHTFSGCFQCSSEMEEISPSTSSALNVSGGVKTATFYGWKYNHYFVVVEEGERNLWVCCTLCAPSQKTLSSACNTMYNFKKHLDTVHKGTKLVGKEPAKEKRSRGTEDDDGPPPKWQCMLLNKPAISPMKLRSLMLEYIVEDMLPL